ncbi:MAG TPA: amidohydrolase family protein [Candidatus Udaeobacter sp.]|jgi:cytosine/adenosine deaminase-related metal-dependent hydrolase|nr:amidohydrolase family protein [Candidatus Udaeobacter sp.]
MIIGPCTIVTGGPEPHVLEEGAVRIEGAHIAQVGPAGQFARAFPDQTLWPARGRVLMPGLVNTHVHLARHLARGLGLRTPIEWRRYERALSAEDVSWAVTAALVEGVRHGVTTVCDFHRSGSIIDLSLSEVVGAAKRVGARVATCYGASEIDTPLERRAAFDESLSFAHQLSRQRPGRLRGVLGVQASTLEGVGTLLEEAEETAADRLAIHLDLALDLTPAERWRAPRDWPPAPLPALWAHAEVAPRDLVAAVRERGDALSAIGSGSAATLSRDAGVGWGSDSGLNAPPLPDLAHTYVHGARAELHYQRLFVHGARWASRHFGEGLGEIAPGAPADLLLVDYRAATEFSARTLIDHLTAGLLRAPISGVMIAGEVVMDNGTLITLDEREVATRARECARRLWARL